MRLTVPALHAPEDEDHRQASAQETLHLLEEIDAVLAENSLAGTGRWPGDGRGPRPVTPAA